MLVVLVVLVVVVVVVALALTPAGSDAPCEGAWPLLGHLLHVRSPPLFFHAVTRMHRKLGSAFRIYLGPMTYVVVSHPRDLKLVLGSSKVVDRDPLIMSVVGFFTGRGLLTTRGYEWRAHRKAITPAFHSQVLERFMDVFNENSVRLADRVANVCGQRVDAFALVSDSSLQTIVEASLGPPEDGDYGPAFPTRQQFTRAVARCSVLTKERVLRPWLQLEGRLGLSPLGRQVVDAESAMRRYCAAAISRRLSLRQPAAGRRDRDRGRSFLDLIVSSAGGLLSEQNILDEICTLLLTGYETPATTVSFALGLLALHPEWQRAVHSELDAVFGGGGEEHHQAVTSSHLAQLCLLDRVIKETLRLFPSAPIMPRIMPLAAVLPGSGYRLARGCSVMCISYLTHRIPDFFPEPEKFDPDRFLPENFANRDPFCYIPFGAGLRSCVGPRYAMRQMKTVLATLLRRFSVQPISTMEQLNDLELYSVIRPKDGVQVVFQKRIDIEPTQRMAGLVNTTIS